MAKARPIKYSILHDFISDIRKINLTQTKDVDGQTIYNFKDNIVTDIDYILNGLAILEKEMDSNYNELLYLIDRSNFHYLSVLNTGNCTINSIFNIIINYAIYSKSLYVKSPILKSSYRKTFEKISQEFKTYLTTWYGRIREIITHESCSDGLKNRMYQEERDSINRMIELLFKGNKLKLRYIHCCYLMLHIVIYTKCFTEKLCDAVDKNNLPNFDVRFGMYGYNETDEDDKLDIYYKEDCIDERTRVDYRRSNRYGNYLLKLFYQKIGKIFTKKPKKILLLTDLLTDADLPSSHNIEHVARGYKYCLVKYYRENSHANVVLFKFNDDGSIKEKTLIDDHTDIHKSNDNGYNYYDPYRNITTLVSPGFYIAHKLEFTRQYFEDGLQITSDYHIPSALLFGGFMQSILLVILVIAIIVCVVIYIHDRKYVKAQQRMLDKK